MRQVKRMVPRYATPILSVGDRMPEVVYENGDVRIMRRALMGRPFIMVKSSLSRVGKRSRTALLVLSGMDGELWDADDPARHLGLFGADGEPEPIPQYHALTFYVVDVFGVIREIHVEQAGPYRQFESIRSLRAAIRALSVPPFAKKPMWAQRDALMMRLVSTLGALALEGPPTVRNPRESGTSLRVPDSIRYADLVSEGVASCAAASVPATVNGDARSVAPRHTTQDRHAQAPLARVGTAGNRI